MLIVNDVFLSINGEVGSQGQGSWTTFVRFQGCSALCKYCDSRYSQVVQEEDFYPTYYKSILSPFKSTVEDLIKLVKEKSNGNKNILITGGEPLEQPREEFLQFLRKLTLEDYNVSIESNGAMPIRQIKTEFPQVTFILDFKTPSSGIKGKLFENDNLLLLNEKDKLKVVVSNEEDFNYAHKELVEKMIKHGLLKSNLLWFSPTIVTIEHEGLINVIDGNKRKVSNLLKWMKEKDYPKLGIGLNLQIHKLVGVK